MSYRAVPLAALLAGLNPPPDSVIEAVALDGFAAQLPLDLITNTDAAEPVALLAIEPADTAWPPLPGKIASAGPFYIVWIGHRRRRSAASNGHIRWRGLRAIRRRRALAALGVDPALPATHPIRAGQALFVTQCLPCHTLNGAGASMVGPDLNQPMNPAEYLTFAGCTR